MKKYRLLKDIPDPNGPIRAGKILYHEHYGYHFYLGDQSWYCNQEFINANPEFFEEVTRWKPKKSEKYYWINYSGEINEDNDFSEKEYAFGNYFQTKAQAEHARDEIKKLLLKLHENE